MHILYVLVTAKFAFIVVICFNYFGTELTHFLNPTVGGIREKCPGSRNVRPRGDSRESFGAVVEGANMLHGEHSERIGATHRSPRSY